MRKRELYQKKYPLIYRLLKPIWGIIEAPEPTKMYQHIKLHTDKRHFHKTLKDFLDQYKDKRILDLGAGNRKLVSNAINLDVCLFQYVDVVANGHKLPFKSNTFDAIVVQQVLEHIEDPAKVIAEVTRILKYSGGIYLETPFMYVYHPDPTDYQRYTLDGLQNLLSEEYTIIDRGINMGPSSTISLALRVYLAMLFSGNSDILFALFLNLFGWLTFPIKYLDDLGVIKNKRANLLASSVYVWAEKR